MVFQLTMITNSKQISFADFSFRKYKRTRTETFLQRALQIVDLSFTKEIHKKLYGEYERGRKPYDALVMFKILLLQQWFGLSDSEAEELIHDRKSFQEFLGLTFHDDIPDETTICNFRNALIQLKQNDFFFEEVQKQLLSNGIQITEGKIIDATINEVPKGKKRKDGTSTRDEEASFTKKNDQTYHGYKGHISTDTKGRYIQKCYTSTAKDHDSKHEDKITDGKEKVLFKDSAYVNKEQKKEFRKTGKFYGVVERATRGHPLSNKQKKKNKKLSSVRCRVERVFAEIKCRMHFKARYRGIEKNDWQFAMASATYNLKRLIGELFQTQKQAVTWIN